MVPTPTMAPVMVCVVDTGMPACAVKNNVDAAASSELIPPAGVSLVIFDPIVCTIRQPPKSVPSPIAVWAHNTTHSGTPESGGTMIVRDQEREDDAHRLLGVVGPMTQAERRRRHQLHPPEPPMEPVHAFVAMEQPVDR